MLSANVYKREEHKVMGKRFHLKVIDYPAPVRRRRRPHRSYRPPKRAVASDTRRFDPLSQESKSGWRRGRVGLAYLILALLIHAGVVMVLIRFGDGRRQLGLPEQEEKVVVRIIEPEIPKPIPKPETPAVKETAPEVAPKVEEKAPPVEKRTKNPVPKTPEPQAADPVDMADAPQESPTPRRRVVGISFESTVKGGKGPTFAVGNTRMGETGERASGPTGLKPLPKGRTSGKVGSPNRVASAIPSAGVTLVKPKRLSALQPDYPSILKAQGVEGNVVVLVSIDEKGQVTRVKILKGSGYDAMDTSAKRAAAKERFSPARRNGEPIAYTLKYTYRFRVRES